VDEGSNGAGGGRVVDKVDGEDDGEIVLGESDELGYTHLKVDEACPEAGHTTPRLELTGFQKPCHDDKLRCSLSGITDRIKQAP
jgi:hypothetical protein